MNYKCHYDIASYIYKDDYIKTYFKYDENNSKWLYLEKEEWIEDKKSKKLINEIKTRIVNNIINKHKELEEDKNEIDYYKSIFLLETALKLKNDNYLKKIIKELKQFFQ